MCWLLLKSVNKFTDKQVHLLIYSFHRRKKEVNTASNQTISHIGFIADGLDAKSEALTSTSENMGVYGEGFL